MKKRLLANMPICALLIACRGTPTATIPLRLSVWTDRDTATVLAPVGVTISLTNEGHSVAQIQPYTYTCRQPYSVSDETGHTLALPLRACAAIKVPPVEIAPGDSLVVHDYWFADEAADRFNTKPARPGSYRIVAELTVGTQTLVSKPLAITVK